MLQPAADFLQMESVLEARSRRLRKPAYGATGDFERFCVLASILT